MADTDPVKWILLDSDLTTSLGELPVVGDSGLYIQLNEAGSGSLSIRYDSAFRPLMTYGTFCECYYRGASRGGFFVENIKETWAETSEYSGRAYAVSGRGLLAILEQGTILGDGSTSSTRNITSSKANALLLFLVEAQAEGCFPNLTWDFDSTVDSNGDAWTDGEVMSIPVGTKILEFMKDVAKFGIDFTTSISGGNVVLSAWQTNIGANKSSTVFMRVGSNCQQVGNDITSSGFANVLRYKWKEGYGKVEDATSISTYGRRESFINLEVAQSAESAATFASARLEQLKNPKRVTSITTYDGIAPNIFLDYEVGDTISLDNMGTITSDRIQSANLDFTDNPYADVTLQLNDVFIERELKGQQDLDWLLNQWNTARDQELAETTFWAKFGESEEISDIKYYDGKLYIAGTGQTGISELTKGIATYDLASGSWSSFTIYDYAGQFPKIGILGSNIVVGTAAPSVHIGNLIIVNTSGTLINDLTIFNCDGVNQVIDGGDGKAYAATDYQSGSDRGIAYINSSTDGLLLVSNSTIDGFSSVAAFDGDIYAGAYSTALTGYGLHKVSGGALVPVTITQLSNVSVKALQVVGNYLAIAYVNGGTHNIGLWDGSSSSLTTIAVTDGLIYAMDSYLTDLYVGGTFNNITGVSGNFNGVAKYNSAGWQGLGIMPDSAGVTGTVKTLLFNNLDLYVGGSLSFAQGNNIAVENMAIYFNNMQHALDYNSKSAGQFDLAGAIHNASASAVTDNDEFVFWEDVSKAIRKITWANIKATLETYFDTLYSKFSFKTISVSGQSDVVADAKDDTLTLVAGSNITITTDAGADSITIASSGGGREILTANRTYYVGYDMGVCTMTIASPCVVTDVAHGLSNGDPVVFRTTGALPTGITQGTVYYVVNKATDTFQVSTTVGGSAVNTSGSQSGTHSYQTGSDSNAGLTTGRAGAFLTIQKAINTAASLDTSVYDVTIQLADGIYQENVVMKSTVGAGAITIQGNSGTPANVVVTCSSSDLFYSNYVNTIYKLKDFKMIGTGTASRALYINIVSQVWINNVEFSTGFTNQHINASYGIIIVDGNYSISGGATAHVAISNGFVVCVGRTVTITGTPAFTNYALVQRTGVLHISSCTFSGSATGARYSVTGNGVIDTGGGGATYLPGNSAGSAPTGLYL